MFENAIKIKNVCPEFKKSTERTNTNKSGRFQRNLGSQLPDVKAISIIKKIRPIPITLWVQKVTLFLKHMG